MNTDGRIYLDCAAATPLDPRVEQASTPFRREQFGNPESLHSFGQAAMAAVSKARETIASAVGASPAGGFHEIIFTGSATEANNLVLRGLVKAFQRALPAGRQVKPRIIVSAIEHESVLETAEDLKRDGVEVVKLPVNRDGFVEPDKLKKILNERTVVVSVMYANNVIGTVQPIFEISRVIRDFKETLNPKPYTLYPFLHTDAVQAFQYLDCSALKLGADFLTLSAHKVHGPKGIGALYVRKSHNTYPISPILTGGNQEFGMRSGTSDVPAIVGLGRAVELVEQLREKETERMKALGLRFFKSLKSAIPRIEVNGGEPRVPSIWNIHFPLVKAAEMLIKLDMAGIAASQGSACKARSGEASHVLHALGYASERVNSSIRFSFGRFTTESEIDEAVKRIGKVLNS